MVKLFTRAGLHSSRYLVLVTLTATLTACGGGSGDVPLGDQDFDGDTIKNSEDPDADGDGLDDRDTFDGERIDPFVDLDLDGLDDISGLPEITIVEFDPVTANDPCGSAPGSDNNSSNAAWNDNCWVRVNNGTGEGQHAISLYTVGIQRIVYCSGVVTNSTFAEFVDGDYGLITEAAVREFQLASPNPQTGDGEVGPGTWAKLQEAITLLETGTFGAGVTARDAWGFASGPCADTVLFYQNVTLDEESQPVLGGWSLARNAPNAAQSIPFSIDSPAGL